MAALLQRRSLDGEHFEVLIIGGGINGVAIARDCALAGKKTLLVEAQDFAAGTTSRSTRIIHGGLRYLQHGDIGMVRESLRERQRLIADRPHLVRPMHFLLALPRPGDWMHSALAVRFGLSLYRRLGGSLRPAIHAQRTAFEQQLDSGRKWAIFNYEDAQCEFPELLVSEWLCEATGAGAVVRNHSELLQVDVKDGRARGARVRDSLCGNEYRVTAEWVVNATGPWADRVCAQSGIDTRTAMVGGVRGTHIVVGRWADAPADAVYTEAEDRRPVFVIPWNSDLLVGTTEVFDNDDPGKTTPTADEVCYLIRALQRLFPALKTTPADVKYAFAGVRPLPNAPGKTAAAITRRHVLHDHADDGAARMVSVIGGKLTTAAALARDCARLLGIQTNEPRLAMIPPAALNGLDSALQQWSQAVATSTGIPEGSALAIARWHGARAFHITRLAACSPELRVNLCPHTAHVAAEAAYGLKVESAITLADILLRRVPVALSSHWSHECTKHAAHAIASIAGWDERSLSSQVESFTEERARFLRQAGSLLTGVVRDGTPAETTA